MEHGSKFEQTKMISRNEVEQFAQASGDLNPIHRDDLAAQAAGFPRAIAHGMLIGAWISKTLGVEFPGAGTIYLHQSLDFKEPVLVDSSVTLKLEVLSTKPEKGIIEISTIAISSETQRVLATGKAVVKNKRVFS